MASRTPNPAQPSDTGSAAATPAGIPGSAAPAHPSDGIPLPAHGFDTLDLAARELATIPAVEVIRRAAVLLLRAGAEQLGLAPGAEPDLDLGEARLLITALAGLLAATDGELDDNRQPLVAGLRTLQDAFREASVHPDPPGQGPGEQLLS